MATWTGFATTSPFNWGVDGLTGAFDAANSTSNRAILIEGDGTKTYLNGTNIMRPGNVHFSWTNLSSVQHVAADGTTALEQIAGRRLCT
jgi:hypothetical protein